MDLWELMQQHGLYVLDKTTGFAHRAELSPVEQALVDLAVAHALVTGRLLWPAQEQ